MGADAVLVNTALAVAEDPIAIARAFRQGEDAGAKCVSRWIGRGFRSGRPHISSPHFSTKMKEASYLDLFHQTDWNEISSLIHETKPFGVRGHWILAGQGGLKKDLRL